MVYIAPTSGNNLGSYITGFRGLMGLSHSSSAAQHEAHIIDGFAPPVKFP